MCPKVTREYPGELERKDPALRASVYFMGIGGSGDGIFVVPASQIRFQSKSGENSDTEETILGICDCCCRLWSGKAIFCVKTSRRYG